MQRRHLTAVTSGGGVLTLTSSLIEHVRGAMGTIRPWMSPWSPSCRVVTSQVVWVATCSMTMLAGFTVSYYGDRPTAHVADAHELLWTFWTAVKKISYLLTFLIASCRLFSYDYALYHRIIGFVSILHCLVGRKILDLVVYEGVTEGPILLGLHTNVALSIATKADARFFYFLISKVDCAKCVRISQIFSRPY